MSPKFRIGVIGLTHDHIWGVLADLRTQPGVELVGVADTHRPLVERAKAEYGCVTYREAALFVEREQLDAVYLFGDNASAVEAAELAAKKGLHILVEKPMASDLAGADRMLAAARQNNVRLMINWPFAWLPQLQHALALAAAGEIGDIWQVKYRAAHQGPREHGCSEYFCDWLYDVDRNGGGALIDYCCYGALLSRALMGLPARVTGVTGRCLKEDILVEDNAVVVMSYPRGLSISEGSWTQIGNLTQYVATIYGSRGILQVEPRTSGRLLKATAEEPEGVVVPLPEQPAALRSTTAHFVDCVRSGREFQLLCQARVGRDAQEILEAALLSSDSGGEVSLPLKVQS